jgi:flagellar protein FlgJ
LAISPPGDIVMDVINAADPKAAREAHRTLLAQGAARSAAADAPEAAAFDREVFMERSAEIADPKDMSEDDRALYASYQKFEAMVLQSFVKSMLPTDSEEFFGEGTAGEIWKGMMAEQLGSVIAERGGVGIAERMMGTGLSADAAERTLSGERRSLATSLLQDLQTETLKSWQGDADDKAADDAKERSAGAVATHALIS